MTKEKPPIASNSDAWIRDLKPWLAKRIEWLRDELERPGTDVDGVRGAIAELRNLRRLAEPDLPEDGASAAYFPTGTSPS
jgi:hypothetical protein